MNKIYKHVIFFSIFLISLSFNMASPKALIPSICEFSDEYQAWLKLTPEEQSKTVMPNICKSTLEPNKNNFYSVPNLFNFVSDNTYPAKYDSRNYNYVSPVRNQQSTGSCWAFSALSTVESLMLKKTGTCDILSPRHMEYATARYFTNGRNFEGYNRQVGQGGNGYMASNYLIKNQGPVLETTMPFINSEQLIDIEEIQNKPLALDVNGYELINGSTGGCSDQAKNLMKKHIYDYGSISSNVYMTNESQFYDAKTYSLYYPSSMPGSHLVNHAITIVGWDDNFSRTMFSSANRPNQNGAWIVKNSYGTNFGNQGYFYVSYEDNWICSSPSGATSYDREIEDNMYYYDTLGYNSFYGYTSPDAYAANVFTLKTNQELLKEITFATKANVTYEIYLNPNDSDLTFTKFISIGKGTTSYEGYHTYKLSEPYLLENKNFVIMIAYHSTSGNRPVGISANLKSTFDMGNTTRGQSFLTDDLSHQWYDLAMDTTIEPYVSIKASTDNINYNFNLSSPTSSPKYPYIEEDYTITIPYEGVNVNKNELEINIYNSHNDLVTEKFTINRNTNNITISNNNNQASPDTYRVTLDYKTIKRETTFNLYKKYELILTDNSEIRLHQNEINTFNVPLIAVGYENNAQLKVNILKDGTDVTQDFTISNNTITNNQATIKITTKKDIMKGTYTLKISGQDNNEINKNFEIIEYIAIQSIKVNPLYKQAKVGEKVNYTANIEPATATYQEVTWSTSNEEYATVNQSGQVTALKRGTVDIIATSKDGKKIQGRSNLQIIDPSITISSSSITGDNEFDPKHLFTNSEGTVIINLTTQDIYNSLNVSITDTNGITVNYFKTSVSKSTNNNTATVTIKHNGLAPAGKYSVLISGGNAKTIKYNFMVNQPIYISSITQNNILTKNNMEIKLTPIIYPANAYNQKLKYTVTDSSIATIENDILKTHKIGKTTVNIESTDGSNIKTTFTVTVIDDIFLNTNYTIVDNYVTDIQEKTTYQAFFNSLSLTSDDTIKIYQSDGRTEVKSGYIGTGMILTQTKNNETYTYTLVVKGDTSGDGTIGSNDAFYIRRHVLGISILSIAGQMSADVNNDKSIGSNDAFKIRRYVLGIISTLD